MTEKKAESKPMSNPSTDVEKKTAKPADEKVAGRLVDMEEPVTSDALNPAYAPKPEEPANDGDADKK